MMTNVKRIDGQLEDEQQMTEESLSSSSLSIQI